MGSEPRNPTLPVQGMEENSVRLGMGIKVACVSLSLSVIHPTTAINYLCRPHAFHPLKSDARLVGRAWVTCPHVLGPTSRKRGNIQPSGCCDGRQAGLSQRAVCVTFSGLSGCCPFFFLSLIFPSIRVFSGELTLASRGQSI